MAFTRIATSAERIVYRIAGLPVAVSALLDSRPGDPLKSAFAWRYWRPNDAGEWVELAIGLVTWPVAVPLGAAWFTLRNGAVIRRRNGKGMARQLAEQLKLYFTAGVLAPWYYIFSLYEDGGTARARTYLQRFETKPSLFMMLKRKGGSPLNDKVRFADYCAERGIRCVPTLVHLNGQRTDATLPDRDLFVKPSKGRGGRGAERWDRIAPDLFAGPDGQLSGGALLERLTAQSRYGPIIVQPRLDAHPALADLTNGALPTVRIVTCLDERSEPELIGAVFRMSVGANRTVDNLHAGGIAANVDLATGQLSRATNLGADARLGWLSVHPDTDAVIEGRELPLWDDAKQLVLEAHKAFADRVVIGWDVAILEDGPIIIEGNGNSDMDILQRFMREGLRKHRFAELLVHHLRLVPALSDRLCVKDDGALHRSNEAGRRHPHQRQADARRAGVGAQLSEEQPQG